MKSDNIKNCELFVEELLALQKKYNAYITFSCSDGSDTYAIYHPQMVACINNTSIERVIEDGWTT